MIILRWLRFEDGISDLTSAQFEASVVQFLNVQTLAFVDSDVARSWKLKLRDVAFFSRAFRKNHKSYGYSNYRDCRTNIDLGSGDIL